MDNENWQIPHIKKVLDYHNKLYSTDFVLVGRCEQFFPGLRGGWDWVCSTTKGRKGAIEIKRLTEERKHEEYSILKRIGTELERKMLCELHGTYRLLLDISDESLNLLGDNKKKLKKTRELKDTIQNLVGQVAPGMAAREARDISGELKTRLPHIVGASFYAELHKVTDGGRYLLVEIITGGWAPSVAVQGENLEKFKALVQQANRQLHEAKTRGLSETFFILLDLLYYLAAEPDVVKNTFWQLNATDHSNINYAYLLESSVTSIKP